MEEQLLFSSCSIRQSLLYQDKFAEAANILEPLVGLYTLPSDPGSVFLVEGENGPESVFEIQHSKESNGWN